MPLNKNQTVRLVRPHIDARTDDEYDDWHQWINATWTKADSLGRRNPRMYEANWMRVICNNPDCPAEALVDVIFTVARDFSAAVE